MSLLLATDAPTLPGDEGELGPLFLRSAPFVANCGINLWLLDDIARTVVLDEDPPLVIPLQAFTVPSVVANTFWTLDDNAFNVILEDPYPLVRPLALEATSVQIIEDNDIAPGVLEEDWPLVIPIVVPASPSVVASTFWTLDDNAFNVVLEDPYPLVRPLAVEETSVKIIEDNDIAPGVLEEDWPLVIPIVIPQTGSVVARQLWNEDDEFPTPEPPPIPPTPVPSGGGGGGGTPFRRNSNISFQPSPPMVPRRIEAPPPAVVESYRQPTSEEMLDQIFKQVRIKQSEPEQKQVVKPPVESVENLTVSQTFIYIFDQILLIESQIGKPNNMYEVEVLFGQVKTPPGVDPKNVPAVISAAKRAYVKNLKAELLKASTHRVAKQVQAPVKITQSPWVTVGLPIAAGALLYHWLGSTRRGGRRRR